MVSVRRLRPESAQSPGVYYSPQTRSPEPSFARTDVVAFVGFDTFADRAADTPTRHQPVRCDDWQDYVLLVSHSSEPVDDGSMLSHAVRAFFTNGGRRCYVVLVAPPNPALKDDARRQNLETVLESLIGERGQSEAEATGLERALLIDEVAIVDVPDLYAFRPTSPLPPEIFGGSEVEARFQPCTQMRGQIGATPVPSQPAEMIPWFSQDMVFECQKRMLARCIPERWRIMLLLNVPWHADSVTSPSPEDADQWRLRFDTLVRYGDFAEVEEMSCAAIYYPWVKAHDRVGGTIRLLPPTAFAAGVIARRELNRGGPHIAPANEALRGVVQLAWPIDDTVQATLYPNVEDSAQQTPSINLCRAQTGLGIQVWGARTLSTEKHLRYVSVRRCLTAIERRLKQSLDALVFEPNSEILWMQITQIAFSTLETLFDQGALRGDRIEQAFFIRCDSTINGPDDIHSGRVLCEVGVAIVAPAEFLVFRLGRREGVVEVME